jgi:hypothetical protein
MGSVGSSLRRAATVPIAVMMRRRLPATRIAMTDGARISEENGELLIWCEPDARLRRGEAEGHLRHQRKHGGE